MAHNRALRRLLTGSIAAFAVCLAPVIASASAILIIGNANGSLATGTALTAFNSATNTFTFTLTNTSPFDARITGVGFDLPPAGFADATGLDGFSGANAGAFLFGDGDLGNVPQFNNAVLDFGWTTGNSGNFSGGAPNGGIAPGNNLAFTVSGAGFAGLTDATIANGMFVRFQRVGAGEGEGEGGLSDVGRPSDLPPAAIPEPASLTLLASGLAAVAAIRRRNKRKKQS